MSRPLGNCLPDVLLDRLSGRDLADRLNAAILITTTDPEGWPHPALLSYGEVVALDGRRIRLATYRTSRTSANMRRNGRLTFCLLEAGLAYYIKTLARAQQDPMADHPDLTRFEAALEVVLTDQAREDLEPGAGVAEGLRVHHGRPVADLLRDWRAMLDGLRGEA